jgi:hypothetical protein
MCNHISDITVEESNIFHDPILNVHDFIQFNRNKSLQLVHAFYSPKTCTNQERNFSSRNFHQQRNNSTIQSSQSFTKSQSIPQHTQYPNRY